jgi:hypothetical protein
MGTHSAAPPAEGERAELESVLASESFSRSPRLAKLLAYLCKKYFEGEGSQIKEYNIATEALGRPPGFDPSQDAIARVEAHRLRKKLKEYYREEGAHHRVKIFLSPGTYVPVFTYANASARLALRPQTEIDEPAVSADSDQAPPLSSGPREPPRDSGSLFQTVSSASVPPISETRIPKNRLWAYLAIAGGFGLVALSAWRFSAQQAPPAPRRVPQDNVQLLPVTAVAGNNGPISGARLLAGCTRGGHTDAMGNVWQCDRFFAGGRPGSIPHEFLWRTNDPMLFQNVRTGEFSYNIPLKPGTYELHLYFVETTYGPGMTTGGGENSRTFLINLNGQPLMDDFDILSDARGPNTADERIFRDVQPASDGKLHLEFISERGQPIISAIEIFPGTSHRQIPIRFVAQRTSFTDHEGKFWNPDTFYSGGQQSIHKDDVSGTLDPDLYAGERYGNFSYAIPADTRDSYAVTLHLAEAYWGGPQAPAGSGVGKRVFNVNCNGVRLLENLDIYKQAGTLHAMTKTFHGLKPNAQGKIILSFEPVVNYASVYAVEVEDEGK